MSLIFVDVEAAGTSPATGVMTEFGAVEYVSRMTFHGVLYDATPDPDNPAVPVLDAQQTKRDHEKVLRDFAHWISVASKGRPVFVSDNPAYDFQWINYYFDLHLGFNPFGHSGRRISDFYAGLTVDWRNTQGWKKFRVTPHTHMPVDDALGNVEAFETIVKQFGVKL